jgi:hypothetical protein
MQSINNIALQESPTLSPDYDAPSPQGEDEMELKLPDEEEGHTPPGSS